MPTVAGDPSPAPRFGGMSVIIPAVFAASLLVQVQAAPAAPQAEQDPAPSVVDDVIVEGQRTREAAETFVRSVAAPVRGRKAAVWGDSVCVGVGGMQPEPARYMVDRISDWAASVGLGIEAPGCQPDIFVVATGDGDATARELVRSRPREFRTGVGESDRGGTALSVFQNSGRPVRWWHVSLPVNVDTGAPMARLPGQAPFVAPPEMRRPGEFGSQASIVAPSRLTDESRDVLMQAIIVLDTSALDLADFGQVTDYIALVALAQIDPDARPARPSILNLFQPGVAQEETLSRWDRAYLKALYGSYQANSSAAANLSTIADGVALELAREDRGTAITAPAD